MDFADLFSEISSERNKSLAVELEKNDGERRVDPPFALPPPGAEPGHDDGGYRVRPSGISDFCPRREALRVVHGVNDVEEIRRQIGRLFRFGRVFERHLRNEILADLGILIGQWRCDRCDFQPPMVDGATRYPRPKACRICRHTRFSYVEEKFFDPETRIGGSVDGIIRWNDAYHIFDAKTANDRNFVEVVKKGVPSERYICQLQTYMWLSGIHSAVLIYYNKNDSRQHVLWLTYDPKLVMTYRQRAKDLRAFLEGAPLLPDGVCPTATCDRAKGCNMRVQCFKA